MLIHTINQHASSSPFLANFVVVLPFTLHTANRRQAGDDRCEAAPLIMVVHRPFCRVAARWICAKNTGHMRKRSIVMIGMLHHVMLEEVNSAAINPISHPNRSNCRLLHPLNHELHLQKPGHHIWLQHLAAVSGVLFARAALVARLSADDFDNNAGGMSIFVTDFVRDVTRQI